LHPHRYAVGGDVVNRIEREEEHGGGPLTESEAAFWSAELLDVMEYLHDLGIVFRDIKTENMIIMRDGHIKLIDFGFSKHVGFGRTYTRCGSPEYVSPEIVLNRGHGLETDIWSFGVTVYEMVAGYLPFGDEDTHPFEMSRDIASGNYSCDHEIFGTSNSSIRHMLKQCLCLDPSTRSALIDLKNHKWFEGQYEPEGPINKGEQGWKISRALKQNRRVPASLVPIVISDNDDRNFNVYPNSTEETAIVIAGESELQFTSFGQVKDGAGVAAAVGDVGKDGVDRRRTC